MHFFREKVSLGEVWVLHVPLALQFTDIMMKGLLSQLFQTFDPVSAFESLPLRLREGGC
jgi:hypothetical protein